MVITSWKNQALRSKGVHLHAKTGKWQAQIMVDRVSVYLGLFDHIKDAAAAYAEASKRHHKDFGRLT